MDDFKLKLLQEEINLRKKELQVLYSKRNSLMHNRLNIKLEDFKEKVLKSLEFAEIDEESIRIIKSRKTIDKLKVYLSRGLRKEFIEYLDSANIDYSAPLTKKKKKKKKKEEEEKEKAKNTDELKVRRKNNYFDSTTNSVRPLYTPMGNRR